MHDTTILRAAAEAVRAAIAELQPWRRADCAMHACAVAAVLRRSGIQAEPVIGEAHWLDEAGGGIEAGPPRPVDRIGHAWAVSAA